MKSNRPATYPPVRFGASITFAAIIAILVGGCGPSYRELRNEGLEAMAQKSYGKASVLLLQAEDKHPREVRNLHDLGACCVAIAREKIEKRQYAAAMRELDRAIEFYSRAIDVHPGHQASLEGKNVALELKGQFDKALRHTEWAAKFVGPSARQFLFLARELEERGDDDGAFLRYRQAVSVEPENAMAHRAFAEYLLRHDREEMAVLHMQIAYRLDPANEWVIEQLTARGALPTLADETETPR